ncbi:hypothetical protein [Porticoccus sp.]
MQKIQAYLVGALLMFGSATWAAIFAQNVTSVIVLMAIPSLLAGYIYATSLPQYVWGMLLGVSIYMMVEFMMYGPVYQVTGLIYGIGFFLSLACAFIGYAIFRWKNTHLLKYAKKTNQAGKKTNKSKHPQWAQLL